MPLRPRDAITLARSGWPAFLRQREVVERVDLWGRGQQWALEDDTDAAHPDSGRVYMPNGRGTTDEYRDLASRAPAPWARLVVDALVQTMFLDGVYAPGTYEPLRAWSSWQRNGMDAKQIPLYRAAVTHGIAYATVLPGNDRLTGDAMSVMRTHSARKMAAFYDEDDEWPLSALWAEKRAVADSVDDVWFVKLFDESAIYYFQVVGLGEERDDWTFISYEEHGQNITPVVMYTNQIDLDGRAMGEVEPIIPLLRRIDQSTFDRLIVQRFGAWKIRYATGLAKPDTVAGQVQEAMRLKVEDLLINTSTEGRFGTLDATEIEGFIKATEADLRTLSAVTQTPPHHMLGLSSNMQAESLAAVEAGLSRKAFERKTNIGESHEKLLRLDAYVRGDGAESRMYDMQVRWRDQEARSLSQAADAMSKLAQQVGVPYEMLWEMLPGWTDTDTQRAKTLIEAGAVDQLLDQITRQVAPTDQSVDDESGV